ncbi:hypothetical protein Tco_0881191 [Tanacetum coccineum]
MKTNEYPYREMRGSNDEANVPTPIFARKNYIPRSRGAKDGRSKESIIRRVSPTVQMPSFAIDHIQESSSMFISTWLISVDHGSKIELDRIENQSCLRNEDWTKMVCPCPG